jgi:hypothetical protein
MRYSRIQISQALFAANQLLHGACHPAGEIVRLLEPFFDCTEVEGADGQLHEDVRSMIFALAGDAYRAQGSIAEAAAWYRRASAISSGGHVRIYAHMVCKHRLADFYGDALKTLEEHRRRWLAKPIIERFLLRLVAWRMWLAKEGREISRTKTQDYEFLKENAPKSPATSQPHG